MSKDKGKENFLSKGSSVKEVSKYCKERVEALYRTKEDDHYQESQDFFKKKLFHYEDCWDLDYTIACFILPRLMHFRKNHCGAPSCFFKFDENMQVLNEKKGNKKWNKTLDYMIEAFYRIVYVDELLLSKEDREINQYYIKKGLKLFCKNFQTLWD